MEQRLALRLARSLVAALLACGSAACTQRAAPTVAVSVTDRSDQRLSDWASVRSATQLTIPSDVAIGRVDRVLKDSTTNDLLVMDCEATKALYRFARDGTFRRAYAAQPTARRLQPELVDAALLPDGKLIMAGNLRLRRYSIDGQLERETDAATGQRGMLAVGATLYTLTPGADRRPGQIAAYSADLVRHSRFGEPEERLRRWNFFPSRRYLAALDGHLFSQRLYDPVIVEYDSDGRELHRFRMPARPEEATRDLWSTPSLSPDQKRTILRRIHAIKSIYAVGTRLFFIESHEASGLGAVVLFTPTTAQAVRIPATALLQHGAKLEAGRCTFPEVVGGDGEALAVLIDDPELLSACASEFDTLRGFNPDVVERPIIAFIQPRV